MSFDKKIPKPDWFDDSDFEPQDAFVSFKNELVHIITFLNEGTKGTSELTDDKGNKKTVPCINYDIKEGNEPSTFNPIAKKLIGTLKSLFPLTNRTFRIELIRGRKDVDNEYTIQEVKTKS